VAIRKEERWRCQNAFCASEILVTSSSEVEGGTNPRCSCGSVMKKTYVSPALKSYPATEQAKLLASLPESWHGALPLTSGSTRRED
jgi:hypothetical protein